ncbi:MAG TPA: hypothetical protein DCO77_04825 [Nitrospiraceae bacterium]|nr:hypothetical protein [Nitrospiraceae bacterium]
MGDETRVQMREVKKGASAIGEIAERYLIRLLGPLGKKLQSAGKQGRLMALIGVVVMLVSLLLILFTSLDSSIAQPRTLTAKKRVVNIRSKPSVRAKVVKKAWKGNTMRRLRSTRNWHKVKRRGKTGWVAKSVVSGNKRLVIVYTMKGFGIVFLIGAGLFVGGILQRR